ncbi:diguanylate cyclase/phosphodiesterase (GGDEF & EAL domains) with PAS/PAC sensor(s) [Thermosulfurimonas dismutans]|uniref:Diguanylate cyclase/phosphodiesterase (GGDEF & EAL domains) with PAS/PAC sensor(S) n=1 Tax=Thermosulfurimonas dismutans TaxID=999894 RepID=A0A179D194_9BACT|nr:diguanylate cyclase/phosphodiesterase (GGDEF & EAL domains) with PAS/PAC sensor(s) [Thermosulfurimonas dismutans]
MIERALDDFRDLPFEVSINLSFQDFETPGVKEFLLSKVKILIEPQRMVFEILETEDIKNYEPIANFLKELKKRGCKIAIDDFGIGYSNLERLIELKVDYLKIDASLIKRLPSDENVRLLVEAILNFARRVGIKTVAEFVADETLFNLVKEMGIDYSQGYFIGPPEPIEVVRKKYL